MSIVRINTVGLVAELEPYGELLSKRILPYIYDGKQKTDIYVKVSEKFYRDRQKEHPYLSFDECEYLWSGEYFYEQLARFNGIMLHASCVEYNGKAYLFSAPSGTGKSTHTHLWLEYLPGSEIINDDKPALRVINNKIYAFGTPWSGTTAESTNTGVPVAGIAFLNRGVNKIERVGGKDVLSDFFNETVRPYTKELMKPMLATADKILTDVPLYKLSCDMTEEAVRISYKGMSENEN